MKYLKKNQTLYLFLLPVFYVLHYYNELYGFMLFSEVFRWLLITYPLIIIAYLVARKLSGTATKAAFIVFTAAVFLLYFGPYQKFIQTISPWAFLSTNKIVAPIGIAILIPVCIYVIRKPGALEKTGRYFTVLLCVLILYEVMMLGINFFRTNHHKNLLYSSMDIAKTYTPISINDTLKPDIYFLVFDEYASNNILNKVWHFDNSAITNWLSQHDFRIISGSRSNYNISPYSISSELNMDYLEKSRSGEELLTARAMLKGVKSMTENQTTEILKKENYNFRYLGPFENSIEQTIPASEFVAYGRKLLYHHTLPERIESHFSRKFKSEMNVNTIDTGNSSYYKDLKNKAGYTSKTIDEIRLTVSNVTNRKPQFVFGHLMITHRPHIFDSTGKFLSVNELIKARNLFERYTDQVLYANKVIMDLVQHIQQHNKKNTIIIIQGDHGFRYTSEPKDYFYNFNAIYFPDKDYRALYDSVSSVNTFRVVFNQYFNQHLPMLRDSTRFIRSEW